jgi:hypothetical protein
VDLIVEEIAPGMFLRRGEVSTTLSFQIQTESAEVTRWLLLRRDHEYRRFTVVRYKTGRPDTVEPVKFVTHYLAEDSSILAYKLLAVDGGYTYEVTWYYK